MSRNDFMKQLEKLLQNISPAEREEALQYYNDYFDDAGMENEQSVIEALGNPARVAENIKRDLYGNGYGDSAYQKTTPIDKSVIPYEQERENGGRGENGAQATAGGGSRSGKLSSGMIALIVVLCVMASPVLLGVSSGLLGIVFGIAAAWFGMIFGFGAAALSLIAAFFILLLVGISCLFVEPFVGIAVVGIGMICGGVGILFMMLTVAMAGMATPAICEGIMSLVKRILKK